jgi:hypothetical protein
MDCGRLNDWGMSREDGRFPTPVFPKMVPTFPWNHPSFSGDNSNNMAPSSCLMGGKSAAKACTTANLPTTAQRHVKRSTDLSTSSGSSGASIVDDSLRFRSKAYQRSTGLSTSSLGFLVVGEDGDPVATLPTAPWQFRTASFAADHLVAARKHVKRSTGLSTNSSGLLGLVDYGNLVSFGVEMKVAGC